MAPKPVLTPWSATQSGACSPITPGAGMYFNEAGQAVMPDAAEMIRKRNFTLEGFTLEEQIEEIGRIRAKQKKIQKRSDYMNTAFKDQITEAGVGILSFMYKTIVKHATSKFGMLPFGFERQKALKALDDRIHMDKTANKEEVGDKMPEWASALYTSFFI